MIKTRTTLTWKERVMVATSGRNERGAFLWYSHKKICEVIGEQEGLKPSEFYGSISSFLTSLVKSGHMIRANKPQELRQGVRGISSIPEYLYRQTGKPYERSKAIPLQSSKNSHTDAGLRGIQAHEIWRSNPTLPKWFRRMMLD